MPYMIVSTQWTPGASVGKTYAPSTFATKAAKARQDLALNVAKFLRANPGAPSKFTEWSATVSTREQTVSWDIVGITEIPQETNDAKA